MIAALALVAHAIDELRDVDPDTLTADELQSLVIGLHTITDRLTAVAAPLLDRWQHSGVWALDGSKSAAARYARDTHSSRTTAHATLGHASSLATMSVTTTFTGALRRAIEARDRHCQHPAGCDVPADRCDVDHIVPAARSGPTSQANGRLQCPTHNRNTTKHDHGAKPRPERTITRLDELRARIRWRMHQHYPNEIRQHHQAS